MKYLGIANKYAKRNNSLNLHFVHFFNKRNTRMSNVNKVCRVVARIYQAFKKKSFKVKSPTVKEEVAAFKILVKMEQESNKPKVPKNLSIFKEDGLLVSSQRYEEDVHIDLFGVRALPILSVGSQLSQRVLERAHKGADGVCRGNKHALFCNTVLTYLSKHIFGYQYRSLLLTSHSIQLKLSQSQKHLWILLHLQEKKVVRI